MPKWKKGPQRKPADDDGVLLPILAAVLSCMLLFVGAAMAFVAWNTSTADNRAIESESPPMEETPTAPQIRTIAQDGSVVYNLPCGMELTFFDSVPGDVTARRRVATTSFGSSPSNYAAEYYKNVFSSDDEIHAICDPVLGTTTRIMVDQNRLLVDTLKYVEGEEQDAKILFSGDALRSKVFDKQTGKSIKPGKEDNPSPAPEEESPPPSASPSQSTASSANPSPSSTQTASTSPTPSAKPPESQAPTSPMPTNKPQTTVGNSGGSWGEDSTTNEITGDLSRNAYWTKGGKSYHFLKECPSLSRSKNIYEGTLQDALNANKTDPCNNCAGGS